MEEVCMRTSWRRWTLWVSMGIHIFEIPHLIDDFLFEIPAEFGISVQLAQMLGELFFCSGGPFPAACPAGIALGNCGIAPGRCVSRRSVAVQAC